MHSFARRTVLALGLLLVLAGAGACGGVTTRSDGTTDLTPAPAPAAGPPAAPEPSSFALHASDGAAEDRLGGAYWYDTYRSPPAGVYYATPGEAAIDTAGEVALVGAPGHGHAGVTGAGAAYLYRADATAPGQWVQSEELRAADAAKYDAFGWEVALAGDGRRAVIGAPEHAGPNGDRIGAAYVFEARAGGWEQTALLQPDDSRGYDSFGWSVAISRDGESILVGAIGHRLDAKQEGGGAAYLYRRVAGRWQRVAQFAAPQPAPGEQFGSAVALSADGSTAAVAIRGRVDDASGRSYQGRLFLFTTDDRWATVNARAVLTDPNRNADGTGDAYGVNVTLSDDGRMAAVAAPDVNVDPDRIGAEGVGAGAVVVYTTGARWEQDGVTTVTLLPPEPSPSGYYGSSVAFTATGNELAIGEDGSGTNGQGNIYIASPNAFTGAASWHTQVDQRRVPAPHTERGRFGTAIATSGDGRTVLATSPLLPVDGKERQGAAFVFRFEAKGGT